MLRLLPLILLIFVSCASVQSGHYIQLRNGESAKSLSKQFKVPRWKIEAANKDKNFKEGEWIFVPLDRGIANADDSYFSTKALLDSGKLAWPVPSSKRISSKFGHRWGKKHEGVDIPARAGTHIVAAESGVVVYSGNEMGGYGNITVIAHTGGVFTIYAHAKKNFTRKGQQVHRGQVIAQVGNTGRSSAPHLHFEVRHNSKALNPLQFLAWKDN